jgi:hypothetical protein
MEVTCGFVYCYFLTFERLLDMYNALKIKLTFATKYDFNLRNILALTMN